MESLRVKIVNQIEQKQPNFRGLKGLRLVELKKIMSRNSANENFPRSNSHVRTGSYGRTGSLVSNITDSIVQND